MRVVSSLLLFALPLLALSCSSSSEPDVVGGAGGAGGGGGGGDTIVPLGICDDPLEVQASADGETVVVEGSLDDRLGSQEGSCGGKGPEVVYRFVAPRKGSLIVGLHAERGFVVYPRTHCADRKAETFCLETEGGTRPIVMEEGEETFLLVDAPKTWADSSYRLEATFVPILSEGESCDSDGKGGVCDKSLFCGWESGICGRNTSPTLEWADAALRDGGGSDGRIRIRGTDPDGNLVGFIARFSDASWNQVMVNGANEFFVSFGASSRTQTSFSFDRVLNNFAALYPSARKVEVELLDSSDARSNTLVLDFEVPAVVATGEECDPERFEATCRESDLCQIAGEVPLCELNLPPAISGLRLWRTAEDALAIVMDGSDENGDVAGFHGRFLDADGERVAVFSRGNTEGTGSLSEDVRGQTSLHALAILPRFFVNYGGVVSAELAFIDSGANVSDHLAAEVEVPEEVALGEGCDPEILATVCGDGLVCGAQDDAPPTCVDRATARAAKCDAAPTIRPGDRVRGVLSGDNLWTPPRSCSPAADAAARAASPEGVFRLILDEPTTRLRLITGLPGTKANHTIVSVLGSCQDEEPLACQDDLRDYVAMHSTLVMENVEAGEYLVVVDTSDGGGTFELEVQAE